MVRGGVNDGYALGSEPAASKGVGAGDGLIEGIREGCEVEMAGIEEGEIWANLEAARVS